MLERTHTRTHARTHAANEEDPQGFFAMGIRGVLCVLGVCVCVCVCVAGCFSLAYCGFSYTHT